MVLTVKLTLSTIVILNMEFLHTSVFLLVKICTYMFVPCQTLNIPEEIYEHCPYTDICNRTALKSLKVKGMVPCCSSCKCDDQCGIRLDCCFDFLDKYRLKEKGVVACINPVTRGKKMQSYESYLMVQSCRRITKAAQENTTISCKLYNEKGLSLVEPVSARETGDIYINADCAKCNNVHNFTRWNYNFVAKFRSKGSLVLEIGNSLKNRLGAIAYFPPEKEDWSMKRCFNTIQDTCPVNSTFERLCQTLQATYNTIVGVYYKNIFCYKCTYGNSFTTKCMDENGKSPLARFTVLVDNSVIESTKLLQVMASQTGHKTWCPEEIALTLNSDPCLTVYCPEGMLWIQTGCKYFIRRWYIQSFTIKFKLRPIPGNRLPVAFIKALTNAERRSPSLWMKFPCYKVMATFVEVFYETDEDDLETVKSLRVHFMKLTPTGIDPSLLIPNLKKCLNYNWHIQMFGDTYSFRAIMDKYYFYIQDGKPKLYDSITDPDLRTQYRHVLNTPIRKTFFCNQVRLPVNSVEELAGEIRIPWRNITLGSNEYVKNVYQIDETTYDYNKTTFSICVEDLDVSYYQKRSRSTMSVKGFHLEKLVLSCALIWLLI